MATISRRVEARRAPAEPVVVGPAQHVPRVLGVDRDAHLVLRHACEVLVQTHVVAPVAEPLDFVFVRAAQAPVSDSGLRTLGDVRSERDATELDTARDVGRFGPRREISPSATRRMGRCGPSKNQQRDKRRQEGPNSCEPPQSPLPSSLWRATLEARQAAQIYDSIGSSATGGCARLHQVAECSTALRVRKGAASCGRSPQSPSAAAGRDTSRSPASRP